MGVPNTCEKIRFAKIVDTFVQASAKRNTNLILLLIVFFPHCIEHGIMEIIAYVV